MNDSAANYKNKKAETKVLPRIHWNVVNAAKGHFWKQDVKCRKLWKSIMIKCWQEICEGRKQKPTIKIRKLCTGMWTDVTTRVEICLIYTKKRERLHKKNLGKREKQRTKEGKGRLFAVSFVTWRSLLWRNREKKYLRISNAENDEKFEEFERKSLHLNNLFTLYKLNNLPCQARSRQKLQTNRDLIYWQRTRLNKKSRFRKAEKFKRWRQNQAPFLNQKITRGHQIQFCHPEIYRRIYSRIKFRI